MPGCGSLGVQAERSSGSAPIDADAVAVRVSGEGAIALLLRLPPHPPSRLAILHPAPPVSSLPSTGREPGAPRSSAQCTAASPCLLRFYGCTPREPSDV